MVHGLQFKANCKETLTEVYLRCLQLGNTNIIIKIN